MFIQKSTQGISISGPMSCCKTIEMNRKLHDENFFRPASDVWLISIGLNLVMELDNWPLLGSNTVLIVLNAFWNFERSF